MEIDRLLTEFEKATIDVTYGIGAHNRAWEQQDLRKKIIDFANREDDKLAKARRAIEAIYPGIAKDNSGIANHAFECLVEHRVALDILMDMLAKITQSEQAILANAANLQELVTLRDRMKEAKSALKLCSDWFDDRYDGAPDAGCQSMVEPMEAVRRALRHEQAHCI